MLTLDLLRTKIRGDCIEPRYVDTGSNRHRKLAAALIEIFAAHGDCRRGELEEALSRHSGNRVDYRIQRGLAKLLFDDHCELGVVADLPPEELRQRVFAVAHRYHPVVREPDLFHAVDRSQVIAEAGESCGLSGEQVEEGLYADLAENHRLVSFQPPSPQQLLNRYNVALAQAMLYRCREIEVTIGPDHRARHRQLFSAVKFNRLIHTVTRERGGQGFRIVLDGPVSMFRHSQRYGVRMAVFLPSLLQCRRWQLAAAIPDKAMEVRGPSRRGRGETVVKTVAKSAVLTRRFELNGSTGLVSHYPERPQYDSSVEEVFARRFERLKSVWALERESEFIDFKDAVMIPDFTFRHADGSTALLEIVGYWRPEYLSRKLAKLRQAKRSDMIVALSQVLNVSRDELGKLPGEVLFFKNRLDPAAVLERLEAMRRAGSLRAGISS
ncbi:MAG: DUF790 family protein [Candidatus Latescibacterota bacterium]|nr:DUF790 family protein [Candidatus Latescibacterota bacterium]